MAAGVLSEPGTKFGPCKKSCEHRDCAAARVTAEAPCGVCSEPIGYDRAFYRGTPDTVSGYSHAVCLEDALDKRANA